MNNINNNIWVIIPHLITKGWELENFLMWHVYLENQVYALGWSKLGDISKSERYEIANKYNDTYGGFLSDTYLPTSALYNFYHEIKIGDILVAVESNKLHGYGIVKSEPYYCEIEGSTFKGEGIFPNIMKVEWQQLKLTMNEEVNFRHPRSWDRYISFRLVNPKEEIKNEEIENLMKVYLNDNFLEGEQIEVEQTIYERNANARKKCLEKFGYNCAVCSFSFEQVYGHIGKNFIHVHHLNPISNFKGEHRINSEKDLRPVCPNCHAMLHKMSPPFSIKQLKQIMSITKKV